METQIITACLVICTYGKEPTVTAAVVDEERRRLFAGLNTMHHLDPEIHHPGSRLAGPQLSHVLIQGELVILTPRRLGFQGGSLDLVTDIFQVALFR